MLLIIDILTNEPPTIIPVEVPHAMHVIHFPLAFKSAAIVPFIDTVSFDLIHVKGADV